MLAETIQRIAAPDARAAAAMQARLDALTKPPGSLGHLESLAVRLAGITGRMPPACAERAVIVFAADHGVAAEGVSAYPAEVTRQMVLNFLNGGAAVNVLARQADARLTIVDVGVMGELPPHPRLQRQKIAHGTKNFARQPAMTRDDARKAIEVGIASFEPCQVAVFGEMGIGNSTSAAALVAAATGCQPTLAIGPGTGVDAAGRQRKISVIENALTLHEPQADDALALLSAVGGFEIAAIAGGILAAAAARVPVVLDGFICASAALMAARLCPLAREYLIAGHLSSEPGHRLALADLGLRPLLDLEMRLGEGTGALVALHLVEASCRIAAEMATFDEARVSRRQA